MKFVSDGAIPKVYLHDKTRASFVLRTNSLSGPDILRRFDMVPVGEAMVEVDPVAAVLKDVTHRYYLPHCPAGVEADGYNRIIYENVYDQIDFHYYGASAGQKFAMVCKPGSDPQDIKLRFTGQDSMELDLYGFLKLYYDGEYIKFPFAVAYQVDAGGGVIPLDWGATYLPDYNAGTVDFFLQAYDPTLALVLLVGSLPMGGGTSDPQPTWSTLVGTGSATGNSEFITAGAADGSGNLYVAGNTRDEAFPANTGTTPHQGNDEIMFGRFRYAPGETTDSRLDYMTFFGGGGNDKPTVIHVAEHVSTEYLYIGGWTGSSDFPPRPTDDPLDGTFYQNVRKGTTDGFIIKALATTGAVPRATYFGGEGTEMITGVTEDNNDALYFVGATSSASGTVAADCTSPATGFPLCDANPNAFVMGTNAGGTDGFILQLDPSFNLTWSTFIGGPGEDLIYDAAYLSGPVAPDGPTDRIALVGSSTGSLPFTVTTGYHLGVNTEETGYIHTFDSDGRLRWGTFVPGVTRLEAVVDDKTNFVVMGMTKLQASTSFSCSPVPGQLPICTPAGSYQDGSINRHDAFFAEFRQPSGTLKWSSAYGDLGWLGARFPDEYTGPDYFAQQQGQPFPVYRFSDLECDALSNVYAMGLYQHGFWEIDDDQSTLPGFGLYNQAWDPLTGSNQTDLTLYLFNNERALIWSSFFGGSFEHEDGGPPEYPFDIQWYMKGCDFGQDLVLVQDEALYWVGTSGGVELPEACPNVGTSWCEESLTYVGDNLDMMQGFVTRMDLRQLGVDVAERLDPSTGRLVMVPNPAHDQIGFIVNGVPTSLAQYRVANALGQVVLAGRTDPQGTIDVSGLSSGYYTIRIVENIKGSSHTGQFIRQ